MASVKRHGRGNIAAMSHRFRIVPCALGLLLALAPSFGAAAGPVRAYVGVRLWDGSGRPPVEKATLGVTFRSQNWAGIGAYKNVGTNSFTGNSGELDTGAVLVRYEHV